MIPKLHSGTEKARHSPRVIGSHVWPPDEVARFESSHPAELASVVARFGVVTLGPSGGQIRFHLGKPMWKAEKKSGRGVVWWPNYLPPGRARVESVETRFVFRSPVRSKIRCRIDR